MTVNGMKNATVDVNETVTFQCVVQGCPPPDVSLVHTGHKTSTMAMFRKNNTLYERAIRVHSCPQLGRYSCRATNFTGTSDKQLHVAELIEIADTTFTSIAIIIGGSLVGVPLVVVAVACLVRRRKTVRDYLYMRFGQPYLTPTHEPPGPLENIEFRN
ncbi:uncharacterized protein LOC124255920 [Haliotis rubra]|uniref:uncharacterized protein LOC124255920 n=1 Tax=Haliotis rubra TaxID=36100 RepID=UPI001EE5FA4B|nr:uncharacterized protein LOC124255920 [Haliotis rubra]